MISNAGESRKHGPGRQAVATSRVWPMPLGDRERPGDAEPDSLRGEIRGIGLSDDPGLQRIDDLPVDQAGIELAERPRDPRCPVIERALGSPSLSASAGSSGQSPAAASSSLCACAAMPLDDRSSDASLNGRPTSGS